MKAAICVLWPSFIVGGIGEVIFFTVFDPRELYFFGEATSLSRLAVYSIRSEERRVGKECRL